MKTQQQSLTAFSWLTEIVIVGLVALPLAIGTLFVFPKLVEDSLGWIPIDVNLKSASVIFLGYAWSAVLLTFRRSSEEVPFVRALLESLLAAIFAAMVTGAGVYIVNAFWMNLPGLWK